MYKSLPLCQPLTLEPGIDIEFEVELNAASRAIECLGSFEKLGEGSDKDVVVSIRFEDGEGKAIDDGCPDLPFSDAVGRFIYPLRSKFRKKFQLEFDLPLAAAKIFFTVKLWRPKTDAQYRLLKFAIYEKQHDLRFVEQPKFGAQSSSLAWILQRIEQSAPRPRTILDVALNGDCADTTTDVLVAPDRTVDCVRLHSSKIADSRFAVEGARLLAETVEHLPESRQYDIITLCNHPFDWATIVQQFAYLEGLLDDDGIAIVAMPGELDTEPKQLVQRIRGKKGFSNISNHVIANDTLKLASSFAQVPQALHAVHMVPLTSRSPQLEGKQWMILQKADGVFEGREIDGLDAAIRAHDWLSAAIAIAPRARELNPDGILPHLKPLTDSFGQAAAEANRAGDRAGALACRFVAAALQPETERFFAETIAQLRVMEDYNLANRVIDIALGRFPGSWSIKLHQAMVYSVSGRGREAMEILSEYVEAMPSISISARRTITFLARNFARECQSGGLQTDAIHPLLLPDVMDAYSQDLEGNAERWQNSPLATMMDRDARKRHRLRAEAQGEATELSRQVPVKMLMLTAGSWKFLPNIYAYVDNNPEDFEIRTYDMGFLDTENAKPPHLHEHFAPSYLGLKPDEVWKRAIEQDATLEELVEWSDVVFCEWAGRHAIWLSRYLPPEKKLILRLHSYEAFTPWPFFINYGGVDGIIFVAEHIRDFCELQFRISRHDIQTTILPNFNALSDFPRPKTADASRNLAMVGYSNLNKDPLVAVKMLQALREKDPAWRLHLFGHHWNEENLGKGEQSYYDAFKEYISQFDLQDCIIQRGFTKDVASALQNIGFIVSCSRREGTHEAILEGMATGAVPIIRRWPMVKMLGAPETTYPNLQYFDTVDQAVRQIEALSAPDAFAEASERSKEYALSRFDQDAVYPKFKNFVRGATLGTPIYDLV